MKWTWYKAWRKVMGDDFAMAMAGLYGNRTATDIHPRPERINN